MEVASGSGEQRHEACTLDRLSNAVLALGRTSSLARGTQPQAVLQESPKERDVLVVDRAAVAATFAPATLHRSATTVR